MNKLSKEIQKKYPFLSLVLYGNTEYVGIVQNYDEIVMSLYDISLLQSEQDKIEFLSLGEQWWWESNQQIPINIFLKEDWKKFNYTLVNFNSKDSEIKFGPSASVKNLAKQRGKKRNIRLVRRVN